MRHGDPVEDHDREHAEDRELGRMPTLDNREPGLSPEGGEYPEGTLIPEDMGRNPGEEIKGQDHGARTTGDQATPGNTGENPEPPTS
jgi:hypothetical protein